MDVSVLDAGNEQTFAKRNHLGRGTDKVGNVTGRDDAAAPHRHIQRPRRARDEGGAVHEDKICIHRGIRYYTVPAFMPVFTPGMRLHDRYLLEERIGSGGMAQVWRAHDLVLGRQVAVKTITADTGAGDEAHWIAARREAQAAARLSHPHITAVHDYAELETEDGLVPYLVMELLRGETLADRIARGPIPWPQAATIAGQTASALAAAHAQGVVHQDVKPANIMLTPAGVKVLDFGIAAMTGHRENTGWIIGTPAYAPPERLRQAPPDPSADVFGLGAIVCEMVTGRQPFPIHSWEEAARHRHAPPALPPLVPPTAVTAIQAALDPTPSRRPTAAALGRAVERAAEGGPSPTLLTPAGTVAAAASVPAPHHTQVYEPAAPVRKGTSPWIIAGVAVALLAVALGAIFILGGILAPTARNPSALPPSPGGNPAAASSAAAVADTVPALLQELNMTVEAGIGAGQVSEDKARELRSRVKDLQRVAQSQKANRGNQFANEIHDFRSKLDDLADDEDITPELRTSLDGILVRLAAANASAR